MDIQWVGDIGTLLLVGATLLIYYLDLRKQAKAQKEFTRKMRIAQISEIISDFTEMSETGDKIAQYVNKAYAKAKHETAKRDTESTEEYEVRREELLKSLDSADSKMDDELFIKIKNNIEIKQELLFGVWAKPEEKKILKDILELVDGWKDSGTTLNQLIKDITKKVSDLSKLLKAEVENT